MSVSNGFDDFSLFHDKNMIGHVKCHINIMCDEQKGALILLSQIQKKVQNLFLDGNIQSADGLIENHQPRSKRHSSRNANPALLATTKFTWKTHQYIVLQLYFVQNVMYCVLFFLPGKMP